MTILCEQFFIFAKFEYSVTSFDLNDGNWKTFDNLIYNEIYLFSMEIVEDTKINISLFINNTNYEYNEYELSPIGMDGSLLESNPKDSIPFDYHVRKLMKQYWKSV